MTGMKGKPHKTKYRLKDLRHVQGRDMTPALIYALNHPARREILRLLSGGLQGSPVRITRSLALDISSLSYHARILEELCVLRLARTQRIRGSIEHFYVSEVAKSELVTAILQNTEVDDTFLRKPAQP